MNANFYFELEINFLELFFRTKRERLKEASSKYEKVKMKQQKNISIFTFYMNL